MDSFQASIDDELIAYNEDGGAPYMLGNDAAGVYVRSTGTIMIRAGSTIIQIDFSARADNRNDQHRCTLFGTMTRSI